MLRERETIVWVFVMPIVFFFFIGTVTSGFQSSGGSVEQLALWSEANEDDLLLGQLVRRLEDRDYEIVQPANERDFTTWSRRLRVPPAFSDSVLAGTPVKLQFQRSSSGLRNDYDVVRVGRAIYTVLADLIVSTELGQPPTAQAFARLDSVPRALTLSVESAGRRQRVPTGFEQAIPGILVMFTMMIMTSSGAVLLVIERQRGLLRRLAYTPISKVAVVLGKWGGKLSVGIVQIVFGMIAGTILFKMNWGPNLPSVLLLMFVYAAFMATLGILLGSLARSEGQAVGIGVVATIVLAALGGCWWPIEIAPAWMQDLQLFIPAGWAMDGLHKLVSFAAPASSVAPHLLGMTIGTVVLMMAASRIFRYE
jgi:ABC-type Na+ efflux pump permease subunit